jgi:hypothetical protein
MTLIFVPSRLIAVVVPFRLMIVAKLSSNGPTQVCLPWVLAFPVLPCRRTIRLLYSWTPVEELMKKHVDRMKSL